MFGQIQTSQTRGQLLSDASNYGECDLATHFGLVLLFKQTLQIFTTNKWEKCHVHPVYGAGIRTHDLWNMSLLPKPLDQGSRPYFGLVKPCSALVRLGQNRRHFSSKFQIHFCLFSGGELRTKVKQKNIIELEL